MGEYEVSLMSFDGFVESVLINVSSRKFIIFSDTGEERYIECDTLDEFMGVLRVCTENQMKTKSTTLQFPQQIKGRKEGESDQMKEHDDEIIRIHTTHDDGC